MSKNIKCKSCGGKTKLCGGIIKYKSHANSSPIGSSSHECKKCGTRYGFKSFGQHWSVGRREMCRALICIENDKIAGQCDDNKKP